jgi:hypothetical protein
MITKSERYREILAVLARHGIGIVDDEFIKHAAPTTIQRRKSTSSGMLLLFTLPLTLPIAGNLRSRLEAGREFILAQGEGVLRGSP